MKRTHPGFQQTKRRDHLSATARFLNKFLRKRFLSLTLDCHIVRHRLNATYIFGQFPNQ